MRTIIYHVGDEYDVNVEISCDGEDVTMRMLNKLTCWLHDAAEVNNDRGYEITAEDIKTVAKQITYALSARGYYN